MRAHDRPGAERVGDVAAQFGVDLAQVRRDHLISHVFAAISDHLADSEVIFFGGTALARTHLVDGRLSEDIDLIARVNRSQAAARIELALESALRRSHGRPAWAPALIQTRATQPALLQFADGTSIQIQLLPSTGYPDWPSDIVDLHQRYADAPPGASAGAYRRGIRRGQGLRLARPTCTPGSLRPRRPRTRGPHHPAAVRCVTQYGTGSTLPPAGCWANRPVRRPGSRRSPTRRDSR